MNYQDFQTLNITRRGANGTVLDIQMKACLLYTSDAADD